MDVSRRDFLAAAGLTAMGGIVPVLSACRDGSTQKAEEASSGPIKTDTWDSIRSHFELDPKFIHMAGLYITSHPAPVRRAIDEYRRRLDRNPPRFVMENNENLKAQARRSAAAYMGVKPDEIALTDSTTMGTALVITGLKIRRGQEILSAKYDYYSTHESARYQSARSGASRRVVPLYDDPSKATEDQIVSSIISQVRPDTRLVTATWVHSATGLKVPIQKVAERLGIINKGRKGADRVIFFVDGVHGFGVENVSISELGCDFFSAGTHKWIFGPRGTGVLWGHPRAQEDVIPTIPTFTPEAGWGGTMSPGGFKPFEHRWALAAAFEYHMKIGKQRVQERLHSLAAQLKEGLRSFSRVKLYTPLDTSLSSGIVCFDIEGMSPGEVIQALLKRNIVASTTPYTPEHARLTPGIFNTPAEVEEVIRTIREIK